MEKFLPQKMKALVSEAPQKLIYKDVPITQITADEVLIKVKTCGICGSDIARVRDGAVHFSPIIVGHEFAGEIVKIGIDVKNTTVGEFVTAAPLLPCNKCENCLSGQPAMCTHYSFIGSRQNGAMAEYVAVPARNVLLLPSNISFKQATCIEPLTVAIHGIERAGLLKSGSSAIVYGCGTIGILTLQALKAKGLDKIYAIDIDSHKLALAKKLGAYETIDSSKTDVPAYFAKIGKVDYAFETAGINILQSQIVQLVKSGGHIVYVGTAPKDVLFPAEVFELILRNELSITGSWMSYSAPFPGKEWLAAIEYLKSGTVNTDDIITHNFPLSAGYKAFAAMLDKTQKPLKVIYDLEQ